MAIEINGVVLGGNLARDVERKQTPTGKTVCSLVVASNHTYLSNGEKKKDVAFLDVEVWGPVAENCAKYLRKGSPVVVTGRLKQEKWESPTGEKRSRIKIVAANVQFLPSANHPSPSSETSPAEPQPHVEVGQEVAWDS